MFLRGVFTHARIPRTCPIFREMALARGRTFAPRNQHETNEYEYLFGLVFVRSVNTTPSVGVVYPERLQSRGAMVQI